MSDTKTMRVMRIEDGGGLALAERPAPRPGPEEVRIRVRAAGINRGDVLQRRGLYPAPPGVVPDVPGLEYAGEVIERGDRVRGVAVGDRVMGLVAGGGYSEQLTAHHREVLPIPDGFDFAAAAAIPEAFLTAYDALVVQGAMAPGHRVLIHAVGSGVGTAAVQLAAAWGATAIGTSRTPEKLERAKALGLTRGVVPSAPATFADAVTADGPVDRVLELVGGAYTAESVRCLGDRGRLILVGLLAGLDCAMPLAVVLKRRIRIQGTVLRSRPLEEKIAVARHFAAHALPLFAGPAPRLRPVLDTVFRFEDAEAAHRQMTGNTLVGKLVLTWDAA